MSFHGPCRTVPGTTSAGRFLVQAVIIVVVSLAMVSVGRSVGASFSTVDLPFGTWIGFAVGAALVFVPFALLYKRIESQYDGAT
jgi:hypothetical protein